MACLFGHKWNGCRCIKCGAAREHQWEGCKCVICGVVQETGHQYIQMDACNEQCSICGTIRELTHDYVLFPDEVLQRCSKCGTTAGCSQETLNDIAKNHDNPSVRKKAINIMWNGEPIMADIAMNDIDPSVRMEALKYLFARSSAPGADYLNLLTHVARNDENAAVRIMAVEKLYTGAIVEEIAKRDKDKGVREAAIKRMEFIKYIPDVVEDLQSQFRK